MNRHPLRWDALIFGLFFLAVLGQWAVWEQDLLDPDDLAYLAAAGLIALGVVGILATVLGSRSRRQAPFAPETRSETELDDTITTEGNPS